MFHFENIWQNNSIISLSHSQFELGRTQTTLPLSAAVMVNSGKHIVPQFPQRLKVSSSKLPSKVFVKKKSETIYVLSWLHFFKDSTLSTWSLETQSDPFIHSHQVVSEVSKFDVNFILWQSIFSKVLSLRLSRRDFTSHFIFPAPLFIFYPAGSCREKVGEIYTGSIPAAYYSERQTKIPINRRQPALYLLFIGISD